MTSLLSSLNSIQLPSTSTTMATHSVTAITSEADFKSHTAAIEPSALHVLYFQTSWAEPCKQMSTVLSTLASTYPLTAKVAFTSIDADEVAEVSETYNVTQVPFIVLEKDGKNIESISGSDAARLRDAIEDHLGESGSRNGQVPPAQTVTRPPPSSDTQTTSDTAATTDDSLVESKEALDARLTTLVKAAPVMLFMKGTPSAPQCGFSRQTVALLREKGVRYGFFNILADDNVRQGLKTFSDWPTFPQIYVQGELIGGLDIVSLDITIFASEGIR